MRSSRSIPSIQPLAGSSTDARGAGFFLGGGTAGFNACRPAMDPVPQTLPSHSGRSSAFTPKSARCVTGLAEWSHINFSRRGTTSAPSTGVHKGAHKQVNEAIRLVLAGLGRQLTDRRRTRRPRRVPADRGRTHPDHADPGHTAPAGDAFVRDLAARTDASPATIRWDTGSVFSAVEPDRVCVFHRQTPHEGHPRGWQPDRGPRNGVQARGVRAGTLAGDHRSPACRPGPLRRPVREGPVGRAFRRTDSVTDP